VPPANPQNPVLHILDRIDSSKFNIAELINRLSASDISFWDHLEHHLGDNDFSPEFAMCNLVALGQKTPGGQKFREYHINSLIEFRSRTGKSLSAIALAYLNVNLAYTFTDLVHFDPEKYAEKSLIQFQSVQEVFTRRKYPREWAKIQSALAIVYRQRNHGNPSENLEQAIVCSQRAMSEPSFVSDSKNHGRTLNELGLLYRRKVTGNPGENQEQAINYFRKSLNYYTKEEFPYEWSMVQANLGNALLLRIRGKRSSNLERAINYFQSAAEIRTKNKYPAPWGWMQLALGNVYKVRLTGDPLANYNEAIRYYKNALTVFSKKEHPRFWAGLQISLSDIFRLNFHGETASNIEQALLHCRNALKIWHFSHSPYDWAYSQMVKGRVYLARKKGRKQVNLDHAKSSFRAALKVFSKELYPDNWADIQVDLGNSYNTDTVDRKDIEKAIEYYHKALSIHSRNTYPVKWALTKLRLGDAQAKLDQFIPESLLDEAIVNLETAVAELRSNVFPGYIRSGLIQLGDLRIRQNNFSGAITAYLAAFEADKDILQQTVLTRQRENEIQAGSALYFNLAWAYLQINKPQKALKWLEKGKNRRMAWVLALDRTQLKKLKEDDFIQFKLLNQRLTALDNEQEQPNRSWNFIAEDIRSTRKQLQNLISNIRNYEESFLDYNFSLKDCHWVFQKPDIAVVEFLFTSFGSAVFILTSNKEEIHVETLTADTFDKADLNGIVSRWIKRYSKFKSSSQTDNEKHKLGNYIQRMMNNFTVNYFLPAYEKLKKDNVKWIILVPHLSSHILPLHLINQSKHHYLTDDFDLSFAPGLKILNQLDSLPMSTEKNFAGIADPLFDLQNALDEVKSISRMFTGKVNLSIGFDASNAEVSSRVKNVEYVHFACHAQFDLDRSEQTGILLFDTGLDDEQNLSKSTDLITDKTNSEKLTFRIPYRLTALKEIVRKFHLKPGTMVTLSACESGLQRNCDSADEFIGLPGAFFMTGASCVVSSLWLVDDIATRQLMEKFYKYHVIHGFPVSAALQKAQQALRLHGKYCVPSAGMREIV